jgi:hypothetical protein
MRQRDDEAQRRQHEQIDELRRDKARRNQLCTDLSASLSSAASTVSSPRATPRFRNSSFRSALVLQILAGQIRAMRSLEIAMPFNLASRPAIAVAR